MVLEASVVCVDNSEWSRNADYAPTRLETQSEACNLVCGVKTSQHPESSVGLVSMAGERVDVLLSPTSDLGKLISSLPKIEIDGHTDFVRGIQTAQMALKHRQNKNQRQRIIAFVCSPLNASIKQLETLGRGLKKNNVSLDVISLGEVDENHEKLAKLMEVMGNAETCTFLEHQPGERLLADVLLSSPICMGEAAVGGSGAPAAANPAFEFGVDPSTDPELAMALRISMEEERARQAKMNEGEGGSEEKKDEGSAPAAPASAAPAADAIGMEDLDEDVRMALMMSLQGSEAPKEAEPVPQSNIQIDDLEGLDDEVRQALMLSLQDTSTADPSAKKAKTNSGAAAPSTQPSETEALFQNQQFVEGLLGTLPGVDMNDPRIKEALEGCKDKDKEDDKEDKDKKEDPK